MIAGLMLLLPALRKVMASGCSGEQGGQRSRLILPKAGLAAKSPTAFGPFDIEQEKLSLPFSSPGFASSPGFVCGPQFPLPSN